MNAGACDCREFLWSKTIGLDIFPTGPYTLDLDLQ